MAYANFDDVERILPPDEDMPSELREVSNLQGALDEVTDLVIGFLGREYEGDDDEGVPDDVPGAVRRVVARVAMRGFLGDNESLGAESEVQLMGPFSHALNWSKEAQAGDFYLTKSDELRIERFILNSSTGAAHYPMAGAGGWCG